MKEKIAVVLVGNENESELIDVLRNVKYVELRIDEFLKNFEKENIIEWIKKIRRIGENEIIGTVRWYKEAGESPFYIPDKKRLEIYREISDYVDIVDVEIKSKIFENVNEIVKVKNKKIIASYHNFKKTPDYKILKKIVKKGKNKSADFVKIATKVNSQKNLFTLIKLTFEYSKKIKLIITPMSAGLIERLIPLSFGSYLTYVSLNQKTASGQPSYYDILQLTKLYK
jgi:3-dehydroquinate dehydratase-1